MRRGWTVLVLGEPGSASRWLAVSRSTPYVLASLLPLLYAGGAAGGWLLAGDRPAPVVREETQPEAELLAAEAHDEPEPYAGVEPEDAGVPSIAELRTEAAGEAGAPTEPELDGDLEALPEPRAAAAAELPMVLIHNGERIRVRPFDRVDRPVPAAFSDIRHLMRWRTTGAEMPIDPRLVRILIAISSRLGGAEIMLVSGYRLPGGHTRETSFHTRGMAADIRVRDVEPSRLYRLAEQLEAGGIGIYPEDRFVHVDAREVPFRWRQAPSGENIRLPVRRPRLEARRRGRRGPS